MPSKRILPVIHSLVLPGIVLCLAGYGRAQGQQTTAPGCPGPLTRQAIFGCSTNDGREPPGTTSARTLAETCPPKLLRTGPDRCEGLIDIRVASGGAELISFYTASYEDRKDFRISWVCPDPSALVAAVVKIGSHVMWTGPLPCSSQSFEWAEELPRARLRDRDLYALVQVVRGSVCERAILLHATVQIPKSLVRQHVIVSTSGHFVVLSSTQGAIGEWWRLQVGSELPRIHDGALGELKMSVPRLGPCESLNIYSDLARRDRTPIPERGTWSDPHYGGRTCIAELRF